MINLGNRIVNNWGFRISQGYVLIDTGYEGGFQRFVKQLSAQKISIREIRYVFLTHAHDDHAGFLNHILAASPDAQVIMSANAVNVLSAGQNSFDGGCTSGFAHFFCECMKLLGKGEHRFPPFNQDFENRCIRITDQNRTEIEEIVCGTILDTPGHTADSISLLLRDGALFCGDAAMNGLPSLHKITIWAGDQMNFLASWQTMIACKPTKIYPGHGKPFAYGELVKNEKHVRTMKLRPLRRPD